jgi:hypothetical protein
MGMIYGYIRVSTDKQTTENQRVLFSHIVTPRLPHNVSSSPRRWPSGKLARA